MENRKLIFDEALELIDSNRKKDINVIPFNLPRFCTLVPGVMQECSYLFGGYSGDGKSTITDDLFMYSPFDFWKAHKTDIDVEFIYWSLELSKKRKILKGISRELFLRYGIRKDIRQLQSLKGSKISDEEYAIISSVRDHFEELEDKLTIIDAGINPTGVHKYMYDHAAKNGVIETKIINEGTNEERKIFSKFTPTNPNKYTILILDHAALLTEERGYDSKKIIEKISEYSNLWRNNFGYTPVIIQQFSADTLSTDRIKLGKTEPDLGSFGESKTSVRHFDVILATYSPYKFELPEHRGYKILPGLGDSYRSLHLLKDRDGEGNRCVGLWFDGAMNVIKELPKSNEINYDDFK